MANQESIDVSIREAIIRGELQPASWLRLEEMKTRFDVGFSPIREALSRLLGEGLVELERNRGYRVTGLSKEDLEDIAVSRATVECAALRRAIEFGDDRWEADVVGAMHHYRRKAQTAFDSKETLQAWEGAHDALHAALISACRSSRLIELQRRLQVQHLRYRRLIVIPEVSGEAHVEEHERLVALAVGRDVDGAVKEIERHMMITVDALSKAAFWN